MEGFSNVLVNAGEFLPGRLYFTTLNTDVSPKSTPCAHFFTINTKMCYDGFYQDFGPMNLSVLYHYCIKLDKKLNNPSLKKKKIVHYTGTNAKNRVNAAFLIGSYAIINLNFSPDETYEVLIRGSTKEYISFRDASVGSAYTLSLLDCLKAVKKALDYGFFNFDDFNYIEYEYYERVENGDLNWIVPEKFVAFCGPQNRAVMDRGYPIHSPETYFTYFKKHNVTNIIRLNKKAYDANRFKQAGFDHDDMFFIDGGVPNDNILRHFMATSECADGAIAVHCKAGLGRTGTLIACYIMKHYMFSAEEAIAWIRICRPGSIIAQQQPWLVEKQEELWLSGEMYRLGKRMKQPIKHSVGIYGTSKIPKTKKNNDNVTGIMKQVDSMEIHDDDFKSQEDTTTQGDRLNKIKMQRARAKHSNIGVEKGQHKTRLSPAQPLHVRRMVSNTTETTTRILTKRNEVQIVRRSQRKLEIDKEQNTNTDRKRLSKNEEKLMCIPKSATSLGSKTNLNDFDTVSKIKRNKRSLVIEKDRSNPRLVKVLRRCHGQNSQTLTKTNGRLTLPSVKKTF